MAEVPIQVRDEGGELQKEDVVTQELASPRVVEEAVTLLVQNVQAETSDGKVCTQFS